MLARLIPAILLLSTRIFARADGLSETARESLRLVNREVPATFQPGLARTSVADRYPRIYPPPQPIPTAPWPTRGWSATSPESAGLDSLWLGQATLYAMAHKSRAVAFTRYGYMVHQWYAPGWSPTRTQTGFSIAKSVTSALIGILLADGTIRSLDQPVADFVPEWRADARAAITVRHLLSMNSGLHWDFVSDLVRLQAAPDQNRYAVQLPPDNAPGTAWVYHNAAVQVLSALVKSATGRQPADLMRERVARPLGMTGGGWLTDRVGNTLTYQSVIASAQDFAKFGYLFLRQGAWDGAQLIPRDWVAASTTPSQTLNPFYGYLWWLNTDGRMWPAAPPDTFAALGVGERKVYVIPSYDMVVVRLGDEDFTWSDNTFLAYVSRALLPTIAAAP